MLRSGAAPVSSVLPQLYQELATEDFVLKLATPDEMGVYGGHDPSRIWLSKEERFHQTGRDPLPIYQTWWESRDRHLLWLQRAYLEKQFSDYDPTSGRDDEVPYELDHICPSADWARNWTTFDNALIRAECLTPAERMSARGARSVLGGSIGNFRLVNARTNEANGAAPIAVKMPFVKENDSPTKDEQASMDAMMFNSEQRRVWFDASGNGQDWNEQRLIAFQQAIEDRTHWLYRCFYEGLEFQRWGVIPGEVDRPFRDVTDESTQASVESINGASPEPYTWSKEHKAQTREVIESGGPIGTPDGSLGLKHIHGGFGIITMLDLAWAVFKIVDRNTKADIATFASVDELIAAGWAVD